MLLELGQVHALPGNGHNKSSLDHCSMARASALDPDHCGNMIAAMCGRLGSRDRVQFIFWAMTCCHAIQECAVILGVLPVVAAKWEDPCPFILSHASNRQAAIIE